MSEREAPRAAIVDYGVGNLYSVRSACAAVGLRAEITGEKAAILAADAVIVPGMGAFGDAMDTLRRMDLVEPLREIAAAGTPLIGICLGMQLFMTESEEFGHHRGLELISGPVVRFKTPLLRAEELKVPHVGWARITPARAAPSWGEWPLQGIDAGEFMYFVHSYFAVPSEPDVVFSVSRYGDVEFCSSLKRGNVFACQFHPERSGPKGLQVYRNIANHITGQAPATVKTNA